MLCREQRLHTAFFHNLCRVPRAGADLAGSLPGAGVLPTMGEACRVQSLFFKSTLYVG